jgi:RES domain-containing protein
MHYGSRWLRAKRTAVLEVPSAIVPSESNYLLDPLHPEFRRIRIGRAIPFAFDPRMWI